MNSNEWFSSRSVSCLTLCDDDDDLDFNIIITISKNMGLKDAKVDSTEPLVTNLLLLFFQIDSTLITSPKANAEARWVRLVK